MRGLGGVAGVFALAGLALAANCGDPPGPAVPAAPSGLAATARSSSQIDLSWTDNSSDEQGFLIQRAPLGSTAFTDLTTLTAGVTSYSNTALAASTGYSYRVQAYNDAGASAFSNTANATTLAAVIAAPSELIATAVSVSQITLSWTDNSATELGFRVERAPGGTTSFAEIATVGQSVTIYQSSALAANTSYDYRVRAYNASGTSLYSNVASAQTWSTASPPAAPTALAATGVSSSRINLSWTDNATTEAGFKIERAPAGTTSFVEIDAVAPNVTAYANTGLAAATGYVYRVRAYNGAGPSVYTSNVSAGTMWAAPTLQVPSVSSGSVTLTWTFGWPQLAATGEGYLLEQSTTSAASGFAEIQQIAGRTTPRSVTLTRTEGTYYFRVRVFLNQGPNNYSEYSAVQTAVVAGTAPVAPTSLLAQGTGTTQVTLTWADNSTNESGFRVERCTGSACTTFSEIATVGQNVRTYVNSALAPQTTYRYRVRAYNAIGTSSYSNTANGTTLGTTATRFQNDASYPVIYLTIDGVQQFVQSPQGIATGYYYEIPLSPGTHTWAARTGFWDTDGSRFEMYTYGGTFTQQAGVTGTVTLPDPTIQQLLTQFQSSGYWSGEYWVGTSYHFAAFRFYSNGTFRLYDDGVQIGSGNYTLVSRAPGAFTVTFSIGSYQGTLYELFGYFYMRNGPPDWPLIQYGYQGP